MVTELERNLLRRFNVGDVLHRSAVRAPEQTALRFEGQEISYGALAERANRIGNLLSERGLGSGDVVAFLGLNTPEYVATWFGAAAIGAVLLPLNAMLRGRELLDALRRAHARALIVEQALWPLFGPDTAELAAIPVRLFLGDSAALPDGFAPLAAAMEAADSAYPERVVDTEAPCTLLFTSGTESTPKGVVNTHLNWHAALLSSLADLEITRRQRPLLALPLFHVAGLYVLLATIASGATGVLLRRIDGAAALSAIEKEGVTYLVLPATAYLGLLQVPGIEGRDFSTLQFCVAFQYLPGEGLARLRALVPTAHWIGYWGQSELTPLGASTPPGEIFAKTERADPIGRSHLPLEVRLVNDQDQPVKAGEVGEIVVRGPSVMLGYFEDEERTEQAFRGGWHHTGDLGAMDSDGFLYFVDRVKDVIKTGGENVSSQEVEEVIARHPAVAEVSVIGIPDPYWIEAVAAVVVARKEVSEQDILEHCRAHLASFKVPKTVHIVSELPKSASGKILKRELRRTYGG